MIKLLLCLFATLGIAATMLQLRQQRLELNYQANQLHNEIEAQQARLWNQQTQIAMYTAPNAIAQTVGHLQTKLVPQSDGKGPPINWIKRGSEARAE